jgi:hypothetical protein
MVLSHMPDYKSNIMNMKHSMETNVASLNVHNPWRKYKFDHSQSSLAGVRRMLQRPGERNSWQPGLRRTDQPHDNNEDIEIS